MDLSEPIEYRGFNFNDAVKSGDTIVGCKVIQAFWQGPAGVGYTEKRARADGNDAGDVYLGPRRLRLSGELYGSTRADTFTRLRNIRAACLPTLAYADDEDNQGYTPLSYSDGIDDLYLYVRPLAGVEADFQADKQGSGDDGFAIQYAVTFEAKDPRAYVQTEEAVDIDGMTSGTGTMENGDYPTPIDIVLASTANTPITFRFLGFDADVTLTVPDLPDGPCTVRYYGKERIVRKSYLGNTTLAMDLVSFDAEVMYPEIPAGGGVYSWTATAQPAAGSQIIYRKAYG